MKRLLLPLLLAALLLFGCAGVSAERYEHPLFEATLPIGFEPVRDANMLCFAPHGDPLHGSSITFYTTELNWYFDRFTDADYADRIAAETGYEHIVADSVRDCKVDGYDAKRIAYRVTVDQTEMDLIVYAVSADRICFFTLLNAGTDAYIPAFDEMMQTLKWKGKA